MTLIRSMLPVVSERLIVISTSAPVVEAARLLSGARISLIIICDADGLMSGVVTKADVVRQISHCTGCSCTTMVADIMTRKVVSCRLDHQLVDVWASMRDNALRQIPVVGHDARPVGVLYANDALQVLLQEVEHEELLLRDYVMGVGYR